jgi:hypothetical protein
VKRGDAVLTLREQVSTAYCIQLFNCMFLIIIYVISRARRCVSR